MCGGGLKRAPRKLLEGALKERQQVWIYNYGLMARFSQLLVCIHSTSHIFTKCKRDVMRGKRWGAHDARGPLCSGGAVGGGVGVAADSEGCPMQCHVRERPDKCCNVHTNCKVSVTNALLSGSGFGM